MFKYLTLLIAVLILTAGCSSVAPWEKGFLSREEMRWDLSTHETRLREHIYSSKEAASGGIGPAGGGCGCN